jgi:hypothetical protein
MGWRDRDYARFNDDERRTFLGASRRLPPSDEGRAHTALASRPAPRVPPSRSRGLTSDTVLLAALVSLGALIFVGYTKNVTGIHELVTWPLRSHSARGAGAVTLPPANSVPSRQTVSPPADVVGVHWRPQDLAPAANAGRICVTDTRHGQICASFVVGERPADNLTREIERRGLRVQSSG